MEQRKTIDSQIARANENLELSHVRPIQSQTSSTNPPIKGLAQDRH